MKHLLTVRVTVNKETITAGWKASDLCYEVTIYETCCCNDLQGKQVPNELGSSRRRDWKTERQHVVRVNRGCMWQGITKI